MPIAYHQNNISETGDFIISHSHLCKIDPLMGGHPKIFYKAITEPQVEDKPTFNNGNILHHYLQHKDNYIISELTKPGEQAANWAEAFYQLYCREEWKKDAIFLNISSHKPVVDKVLLPIYTELFNEINKRPFQSEEEIALFISCLRHSRNLVSYNKTIKNESTLLEHFNKIVEYINFLQEATGKIILTNAERDTLINCKSAIENHPVSRVLLELEGEVEKEIYWKKSYRIDDINITLNRKAKIDKVIIEHDTKVVTIVDWKTTNYPVSTFNHENGSLNKYRYDRQLANYGIGLINHDKDLSLYAFRYINTVVQTIDPYPVINFEISDGTKAFCYESLKSLEKRVCWHIINNKWNITKEENEHNFIEV